MLLLCAAVVLSDNFSNVFLRHYDRLWCPFITFKCKVKFVYVRCWLYKYLFHTQFKPTRTELCYELREGITLYGYVGHHRGNLKLRCLEVEERRAQALKFKGFPHSPLKHTQSGGLGRSQRTCKQFT